MSKFNFQQRVLAGFAFTLFFVFVTAIVSYLSIKKLQRSTDEVYNTVQIIIESDQIIEELLNCETGVRGFVITGNSVFLEPYNQSVNKISLLIKNLRQMLNGQGEQLRRVDSLEFYAQRKAIVMRNHIEMRKQNFEMARSNIESGEGKMLMDQARTVIGQIKDTETLNSSQLKLRSDQSSQRTISIIMIASMIILILVLILLFFIIKTFKWVRHTNEELEGQNQILQDIAWTQSHIVRAPLARMLGIVNIIKDLRVESPDYEEWINHFITSANELDNIIKDIVNKTDNTKLDKF